MMMMLFSLFSICLEGLGPCGLQSRAEEEAGRTPSFLVSLFVCFEMAHSIYFISFPSRGFRHPSEFVQVCNIVARLGYTAKVVFRDKSKKG